MDLLAIVVITLLLPPLIFELDIEPARVGLGVVFVMFSPGYALVSALYPRKERLSGVERIALGIGLSLALVPLLGLALNFTPWGIRLTPIVITLGLWILAMAGVAWRRRRGTLPEERFDLPWSAVIGWVRRPRRALDLAPAALVALAVVIVVAATAWKVQNPAPGEPFTEFYVLGAQKMLRDYPTSLRVGEAQDYNIGIVNHEQQGVNYTVRAFLDNEAVGTLESLTLEDGATWEGKILVTPTAAGAGQRLEFRLFEGPGDEAYRTVHLVVEILP